MLITIKLTDESGGDNRAELNRIRQAVEDAVTKFTGQALIAIEMQVNQN